MPPMPSATSSPSEPVGSDAMSWARASSPSFMIAPLPNCFSIWLTARSIARSRFTSMAMSYALPRTVRPCFPGCATLPWPPPSLQHGAWIFSAPHPPQRMAADRDVQGPGRTEAALVEDQLGGDPRAEVAVPHRLDRLPQPAPAARRAPPAEGQMAAKGARLRLEAERRRRLVAAGRERRGVRAAGRDPGPDHAGAPEARKGAEARRGERQRRGASPDLVERHGDGGDPGVRHRAEEPEGQVKLVGGGPAQVGAAEAAAG